MNRSKKPSPKPPKEPELESDDPIFEVEGCDQQMQRENDKMTDSEWNAMVRKIAAMMKREK